MLISLLVAGLLVVAFICGRKYEKKQFVRVGKKRPTVQDVLLKK